MRNLGCAVPQPLAAVLLTASRRRYDSPEMAALSGLGDGLRALRVAKGMTQDELAVRAKLRAATLSDWEKGKESPRTSALEQILDVLGADLYDLGAAIREQRGIDLAPANHKEPTATSLGMAIEALPDAPEDVRREWARLHDQEQTARLRRYTLASRFVSATT